MISTLDRINALSDQWHGCYEELRALAESDVGETWREASAPTRERLRVIEGRLVQAWQQRRYERQEINAGKE